MDLTPVRLPRSLRNKIKRHLTLINRNMWVWVLTGTILSMVGLGVRAEEGGVLSTESLILNCFICHGTDGKSPGAMPSLNGKSAAFIARKLIEFKAGKGRPTIMDRIARGYTDEEIARIAESIGALK